MKKSVLFALTALALTGCGHTEVDWEKAGATPGQYQEARYACTKDSMQAAPVAIGQEAEARSASNKKTGSQAEMQMQSVDLNKGNRDTLFYQCMQAKGWSYVTKYFDKDGNLTRQVIAQ